MPANPDVGKEFDFEAITDRFVKAGVQYVVFPARCNLGVAYYDTKIGTRHPALTIDLLPRLAEACHRKGIKITAYINAGLSHDEGLHHRDWLVLPKDGQVYQDNKLNSFFRKMCYNSGYGDHLVAMVKEIMEHCKVDGMFMDCFRTPPCYGVECVQEMKAEGVDINDDDQVEAYNIRKMERMTQRLSDAIKSVKPDAMIYFNGVGYEAQAKVGSYLEFECLPTEPIWGYECLPFGCRYLRTLNKPVLNMTGRFHRSWGDFGGIRTEASLEYDCIYGLANGLATTIGDHYHPRGDINQAVADLDTQIYRRLQKLDPWLEGAKAVTEIAVPMLYPYPGYTMKSPEKQKLYQKNLLAIKGATRMLCELKQQFDIPSHFASWDKYDLLVLPDFVAMDEETRQRIRKHLDKGGKIIASAWSGLTPDGTRFAFDEWGVDYIQNDEYEPTFFLAGKGIKNEFPDMPMALYNKGVQVRAKEKTEVLGTLCTPYYTQHWDGEHGFVYIPPKEDSGMPALTASKSVGYVSHPIFTSYYSFAPLPMRELFKTLLKRYLPRPLVKVPNAPSYARVTVTEQVNRRMVYYLAYLPESRGAGTQMIEEPLTVTDQKIMLRLDGKNYRHAYLAPERTPLELSVEEGYAVVTLPCIKGYSVVVFEE